MSREFRFVLLVVLILAAVVFGWRFKTNYDVFMAQRMRRSDTDLVNVRLPDYQKKTVRTSSGGVSLGVWGAGMVLSLIGAGLLVAHEVSQYLGAKSAKAVYSNGAPGLVEPEYDAAEEAWARGDFLGAIQLMREYLQANPREQHVALRIAEIYEKDLNNPLAAALEYEEVLKQKLPPERWGWAAIHLCNLYSGRLNQPDRAVALLHHIDAAYGQTAAAEKARSRLAQLAAEGLIAPVEPPPPPEPPEPPGPSLPPGFAPKKR